MASKEINAAIKRRGELRRSGATRDDMADDPIYAAGLTHLAYLQAERTNKAQDRAARAGERRNDRTQKFLEDWDATRKSLKPDANLFEKAVHYTGGFFKNGGAMVMRGIAGVGPTASAFAAENSGGALRTIGAAALATLKAAAFLTASAAYRVVEAPARAARAVVRTHPVIFTVASLVTMGMPVAAVAILNTPYLAGKAAHGLTRLTAKAFGKEAAVDNFTDKVAHPIDRWRAWKSDVQGLDAEAKQVNAQLAAHVSRRAVLADTRHEPTDAELAAQSAATQVISPVPLDPTQVVPVTPAGPPPIWQTSQRPTPPPIPISAPQPTRTGGTPFVRAVWKATIADSDTRVPISPAEARREAAEALSQIRDHIATTANKSPHFASMATDELLGHGSIDKFMAISDKGITDTEQDALTAVKAIAKQLQRGDYRNMNAGTAAAVAVVRHSLNTGSTLDFYNTRPFGLSEDARERLFEATAFLAGSGAPTRGQLQAEIAAATKTVATPATSKDTGLTV